MKKIILLLGILLLISSCIGILQLDRRLKPSTGLKTGFNPSVFHKDWAYRDDCTICHMAWSWKYGYYRGWDRYGLISDYTTAPPVGYKDPYSLDSPDNSFKIYYYTDWWKGKWLKVRQNLNPITHLDGYSPVNDGTAAPEDFKGKILVVNQSGTGDATKIKNATAD